MACSALASLPCSSCAWRRCVGVQWRRGCAVTPWVCSDAFSELTLPLALPGTAPCFLFSSERSQRVSVSGLETHRAACHPHDLTPPLPSPRPLPKGSWRLRLLNHRPREALTSTSTLCSAISPPPPTAPIPPVRTGPRVPPAAPLAEQCARVPFPLWPQRNRTSFILLHHRFHMTTKPRVALVWAGCSFNATSWHKLCGSAFFSIHKRWIRIVFYHALLHDIIPTHALQILALN